MSALTFTLKRPSTTRGYVAIGLSKFSQPKQPADIAAFNCNVVNGQLAGG